MRILLAQLNPTIGDFEKNTNKILQAIHQGVASGVDIVLFPELAISGYSPQDLLLSSDFIERNALALNHIVAASQEITVIIGTIRPNPSTKEKPLYNSAAIIENGRLLGFHDKILLPTYDVFDERRYFEPGKDVSVWNIRGKQVAITVCEDMWEHGHALQNVHYHRNPIQELAAKKPDLLLNLSASPFSVHKAEVREKTAASAAKTLGCPHLLCNQVGGDDNILFDGHSFVIDETGILRSRAKGFEEDLFLVDLDHLPTTPPIAINHTEATYQALVMGVRDYFHKQGLKRACLGLSGGIDSAVVAAIATDSLGAENVLGVLMPSRYSSQGSVDDALALAKALKISHETISIEQPFQAYLDLLKPVFGNKSPDVTEENLQARIRGMILMALSNKYGHIVLNTGNKSEFAMGYSTLYGDQCGGLSVIGDATKKQVYDLAHWINRHHIIIPINTIQKAPSAELRENQKDTDSLPDYAILDVVVESYLEQDKSASVIAQTHSLDEKFVEALILRIHQNEYKRRQAPPSLRISEKAFSAGRFVPIVHA